MRRSKVFAFNLTNTSGFAGYHLLKAIAPHPMVHSIVYCVFGGVRGIIQMKYPLFFHEVKRIFPPGVYSSIRKYDAAYSQLREGQASFTQYYLGRRVDSQFRIPRAPNLQRNEEFVIQRETVQKRVDFTPSVKTCTLEGPQLVLPFEKQRVTSLVPNVSHLESPPVVTVGVLTWRNKLVSMIQGLFKSPLKLN